MRRIEHANGVITYEFDILTGCPVSVHVSTRHGGISPSPWNTLNFSVRRGDTRERVRANQQRLAEALKVDAAHFVKCQQVHGRFVEAVGPDAEGSVRRDADGLVTDAALLPLSLVFADCVPIALYDRRRHVLGLCHAGWRGTVQGTAAAALEAMAQRYSTAASDVLAGIGPSIGPASYEVGDEVIGAVRAKLPNAQRLLVYLNGNGRNPHFDMWEANRSQLILAGVPTSQIELSEIDTATNTHDFFSHRGERGRCGLFSMVGWLHDSPP